MICYHFKTTFNTILTATIKKIVLTTALLSLPLWSMNESTIENQNLLEIKNLIDQTQDESDGATRAPKNKDFLNVRVYRDLGAQRAWIQETAHVGSDLSVTRDATLGGNLAVQGDATIEGDATITGNTTIGGDTTLTGTITITGTITAAGDFDVTGTLTAENIIVNNNFTTENALINNTLTLNGTLDALGDVNVTGALTAPGGLTTDTITINTITKNGNTVSWPSTVGAPGTLLGITAPNALGYITPAGGGNVSTASNFTTNNRLVTTDLPSSATNIKQTAVTLDGSNNISGINTLGATTISATTVNASTVSASTVSAPTLNGTANDAYSFLDDLAGDVTGPQTATHVAFVGGKSATDIMSTVTIVQNATNTLTPNTLVLRDDFNNFRAGTITANITGNISGSAGTAGFATNATTAVNFSGSLSGNVTGTQGNTIVTNVGGSIASAIHDATVLANQSTDANTGGRIVRRTFAGDFNGGTITAENHFEGNLTGYVTGSISGDAATATSAVSSTTAQWFTQDLAGDVTGAQKYTYVNTIQGTAAATVVAGAALANAATPNNTINTLVQRDALRHFTINNITLSSPGTDDSDAATRGYVNQLAGTGFVVKESVLVTSLSQTTTAGLITIDSFPLSANNRVLLNGQADEIYNGLWLAQTGDWTRPNDFLNGTLAGQAYVLTTTGLLQVGTSWVCNTPLATVGTNTLVFGQFGLQGATAGNNVGTGSGEIYKDKTGVLLNFKTLAAATVDTEATGNFVTITNSVDNETLSLAVTATSDATANTLVARDAANTFAGTLVGAASANVLKAGDTMTGDLIMARTTGPTTRHEIQWQDDSGAKYVGIKAPATISSSYSFALPANPPVGGQFLKVLPDLTTTWTAVDGGPGTTKTFFVERGGSDSLNDGSLSAPFLTIKKAIQAANAVSSSTNPVVISIGAGIFTEDNSGGPLAINADNINIIGESMLGTIIQPSSISDPLFTTTATNVELANFTVQAPVGSTQAAITIIADSPGKYCFKDLLITSFSKGFNISCLGSNHPTIFLDNARFINNGTCILNNDALISITNSYIRGSSTETPGNTGIVSTGNDASTNIFNTIISTCTTGIEVTGNAKLSVLSCEVENTLNGIVCNGASTTEITGCNFFRNPINATNVASSGAGTVVTAEGCNFYCSEAGSPRGTVFKATNAGEIVATSHIIRNAVLALECGTTGDTATTVLKAGSVFLINNTIDIQQTGTSLLRFISGAFDANKVVIDDPTNVSIASYERAGEFGSISMSIGNAKDVSQPVYEIFQGPADHYPHLQYEPDYYGTKGTIYKNDQGTPTFNGTQALGNNAYSMVITSSRDKETGIKLVSDMSSTIGNGDNVRGWAITKLGNSADLTFSYTNNDSSGLAVRGPNTIMQLDGTNNNIHFPIATGISPTFTTAHLVWAGDTALYRSADATLKIDNNLVVNNNLTASNLITSNLTASSLTANRAVATDANKNLASSATTNTELGYLSGVTSALQPQIASKVFRAGDTMTGTFTVIAGSATSPSLQFANGTNTGMSSATANRLSFDTLGTEHMSVNATGTVTINQLSGTAGVVHNYADGALASSLIVASDITDGIVTGGTAGAGVKIAANTITNANINASAGIVDTKLATIFSTGKVLDSATTATSLNTINTIVRRDATGDFAAGMITASLTGMVTGTASFNVLKIGDTMTGALQLPAGLASEPSLKFTGGTNTGLSSSTANKLSFDANGVEKMTIDATTVTTTTTFISAAACILTKQVCFGGLQVDATNGTTVTVADSTSILLKTVASASYAITMPANPINGQLLTIMLGTGNLNIPITYPGATVYYAVDRLRPESPIDANSNGQSVTYIYHAATATWYRYSRG
jgi:cytoskeletal protein CcmA (bactofilin family)